MTETDKPMFIPVTVINNPFEFPTKEQGTGREAVGIPLAAVPKGWRLESLFHYFDQWRTKPERRTGNIKLSPNSFVNFTNRYKNSDQTVLFAKKTWIGKYKLTIIFDYYPRGSEINDTANAQFRATTTAKDYLEFEDIAKKISVESFYGDAP